MPEQETMIVKRIALVAHDNCKKDLVEWVEWNWDYLVNHTLICTGTTGKVVEDALNAKMGEGQTLKESMIKLKSGPFGGDQQLGAMIAEGKIDILIFFWDPMLPHPHEVDVKALLRISVLYNVPTACNRSTADFIISSQLFKEKYEPAVRDYSGYLKRDLHL
jgi:methylglyoxal synthase